MKRWLWLLTFILAAPAWVQNTVYFTEDFERYTGQLINSDPANTLPFDSFSDPCDASPWSNPVWLTFDVFHGVPAWPNHQLVNSAAPYIHPDPYFTPYNCTLRAPITADPFEAQPSPLPTPRSGNQMLWAHQNLARTQYAHISVASGGTNDPNNPLHDGAYYDWWFYDDGHFNMVGRARGEFRAYASLVPSSSGLIGSGLASVPALGSYDADTEVPPDNRALSRKHYNMRGDALSGAGRAADANPRQWSDFRQVMRSSGWHHAAIWMTGDDTENNPRRITYVIDGIAKSNPRIATRRYSTVTLTNFAAGTGRWENVYYDDVEVGVGTPGAMNAMFVGKVLPSDWRNDSNGYADVAEWIVDVQIRDLNDNLLATVERRLPKYDPTYATTDGTDDFTGMIGIPDLLPDGTYRFTFRLRDRQWLPMTVELSTPSRGEVIMLVNGDVDVSGCVDDADLAAVIFEFGGPESGTLGHTDLNGDGIVDDADLAIVIFSFGAGC